MKPIFYFLLLLFCASCSCPTIDFNSHGIQEIKTHTKFRINLPEDHRTGYTWQLSDDYDKTIIEHTNTVWEGNSNGVFFYFIGSKKGTTTLDFKSRKHDDINSLKSITIEVLEH